MNKTAKVKNLKEKLEREVIVAVGNHYEVYVDPEFVADIHKSIDEIINELLKEDKKSLI
jgi:hypothetical protein